MKSLTQFIIESFPKELQLSFFQVLMISNVCDKYWWKSKWEKTAESIGNMFNDIDLFKGLSNEDMSKLNQLKGDAYTDYFCRFDRKITLKNLTDKEVKDLDEMIEDFINDTDNEKRYGEGAITCLAEIQGNNIKLLRNN